MEILWESNIPIKLAAFFLSVFELLANPIGKNGANSDYISV